MVGTEHMVKSAGSLARKFLSERKTGEDVDTFIEKAGDIVRFSMELPEVGYGVKSVLESLRELGYRTEDGRPIDVEGLKNFWERGNRFYGLNLTLRAPEPAEHLLELQFPTERSWLTGKKTHDWYEIFRQDRFDFDTRFRALLQILKINKFDGLPDNLPDRREDLPPSKKSGLSEWIRKSPDDWEAYRQELAANGRTVDDLLGEFGLTRDDIPRADTADIFEHGSEPPAQDRPIIDRDDSLGRLFGDKEEPPLGEFRDGLDFRTVSEPLRAGMPADPNEAFARLHDQVEKISADQLARAESLRGDPKYWFAAVYHFVTRFELNMIDDGRYTYPIMKLQEVVAFERTFDVNIDHWIHGRFDQVEPNWRIAFRAAEASPDHWYSIGSVGIMGGILPPMKAHIDHDLARAIAAVYEHFYAPNGIPFEAFKPDFAAMKVVFDQASAALLPEILKVTRLPDLGRYEIVQRVGFPFIYDVARAREATWDRAGLIVSGHELGIHDQQGMQDRIEAYRDTRSVFSGHGALKISGEKVLGYDWNHQPGINDRIEARPDGTIAHAEVQQTVLDRIGMHSPDLAEVVRKLLDDPHPLNVTKALHLAAMHEHVIAKIEEIARGSALAPYDGDLQALLADHPGHGPLSEHVAPELNRAPGAEFTRLQEYVQEMKATDEVHTIGLDRTPEQTEALNGYADRLEERVLPAVNAEVESVADIVRASSGGPVEVNSRPKDVAGLDDKIVRMARGRKGSPGRPNYRVGDIIDAVGARMTVPDMAALRRAYEAVVEHFGVGDGGRIVEIDNMYADPKAKNPTYRVIPMVIKIEVDGHKYAFELQLTTLRASVAADVEHNSLYKRYIDITPEERDAIGRAFAEAAALDQLEMRDE
jgi:ppGpp synthetase/RelA/SpoT-type nucleotidyltranferase